MSLTNALDAIAVVGAIILVCEHKSTLSALLGTIAVAAATSHALVSHISARDPCRPRGHGHSLRRNAAAPRNRGLPADRHSACTWVDPGRPAGDGAHDRGAAVFFF